MLDIIIARLSGSPNRRFLLTQENPFVPSILYLERLAKIFNSIKEGILKKVSHDRCDYEYEKSLYIKQCHKKKKIRHKWVNRVEYNGC